MFLVVLLKTTQPPNHPHEDIVRILLLLKGLFTQNSEVDINYDLTADLACSG